MSNKNGLTKILAAIGTLLAWFPILAPALLSAGGLIAEGRLRVDYLMPAELFPFALAGGILLLWAALRAHARRGLIAGSLGGAIVLLVGGQALAVVTGLASGAAEPEGWAWALVMGSIVGYALALVATDVGGALLLRDLFGRRGAGSTPA